MSGTAVLQVTNVNVTNAVALNFPTIAGLQQQAVFGSDGFAALGNQVPAGPALAAFAGGPLAAKNYSIFNPGGAPGGLTTGIALDATFLSGGFSCIFVARAPSNTGPSSVLSNGPSGGFSVVMHAGVPSLGGASGIAFATPVGSTPVSYVQTGPQTAMKAYAITWAGTGTPWNIYDLTDGLSGSTANQTLVEHDPQIITLGALTTSPESNPASLAFWMYAAGALSSGTLAGIYPYVQSLMKLRGFTTV